jgi:hypothetical protein
MILRALLAVGQLMVVTDVGQLNWLKATKMIPRSFRVGVELAADYTL